MTNITDIREMKARIVVFGVGGAGGNAINNMIAAGLQGVDFIVANTDAQALDELMAFWKSCKYTTADLFADSLPWLFVRGYAGRLPWAAVQLETMAGE